MSKKFLRPPQYDESDEEPEDDEPLSDEDEDDDASEDGNKKRGKKGSAGAPPAKKAKKAASSMFDMEADASDDEEEEDDRDGERMDDEALEIIRQQDRRRAQAGGRFGDRSIADIALDIEQRHRMENRRADRSRLLDRPEVLRHRPRPKPKPKSSSGGGGGGRGGGGAGGGGGGARAASPVEDEEYDEAEEEIVEGDLEGGPEVYSAVAQQSLVPSVSDPNLWMVNCIPGKEQELVLQIMNKCVAFARQGRPLGICGAIAAQSKGKIYIESYSEPAVKETIEGVRGLMASKMMLIPIKDMTTVMTVKPTKKPVKKNEWVRMTRGHYKGDLALVRAVKESGLKCVVQCVPRLDLALFNMTPEQARVRRRTVKPQQKFFNPQEIAALFGRDGYQGRRRYPGMDDLQCDFFDHNYYHDGYLLKEMTVGSMIKACGEDDQPTLDELQGFQRRKTGQNDDQDGEENEGARMAASLLDELSALQGNASAVKSGGASSGGLLIGDTVEVIEGDLLGMRGKLMSLDGATVKVKPNNATDLGGTDEVEFLANQVRKYIPVGAHVKVTDGRYANETGTVVAVEQLDGEIDFTAVVLTDVTNKEISVRTSQLRESAEVASGQDKLSGYELYDLVVLSGGGSASEVGVIVRVGREDFTVVNNHGIAREVRPEELRGKRNTTSNRAVVLDKQGGQLRTGDSVNVAEGPHKGKTATIKRMSRNQLFLHSQTRSEHAGIFVVRCRSCVLAGSRSQNRRGGGDGGVSPFATPQSQSSRGSGPGGGRGGGKRDADGLIGKSVRIQAGQWKGYLGTVSDATATHVQVELHSRLKKVMVVRERVAVVGDQFGAMAANGEGASSQSAGTCPVGTTVAAPATMATPMHAMGGATPAIGFGGATPAHHDSDGNDEVWRPGGSIDQDGSESKDDDGWGSTNNSGDAAFGQTGNNDVNDDGWGSSATGGITSTWGSSSQPKEEPGGAVKQENGTIVKREADAAVSAADGEAGEGGKPHWLHERVFVKLKSDGRTAVIKELHGDNSAVIELEADKAEMTVQPAEITMVTPKEHDKVLVAGGNEVGLMGTMVCVDGSDAILKDNYDQFKIIDFVHLVKISDK